MANLPRKHHYVPQVLLVGFTPQGTQTGTLHIVDLVRRSTYVSTPEGAAKEKDYNLVEVDGVDPFAIESDLFAKHIEGPVGPAFDRIRRRGMPTEDERVALLAFIAMQALRAPNRRAAYDDFTTQVARQMVSLLTESDEMFEARKRMHPELGDLTREEARNHGERLVAKNSPTAHLGVQLPSFGTILDLLALRSWAILTAKDADFVCCDDPVVLLPSGTRRPDAPRGFASLDGQVLMPVGRRQALLGVWPPSGAAPMWLTQEADVRTVAAMNAGLVIIGARRFVASANDQFSWLRGNDIADRAAYIDLVKKRPVENEKDQHAGG